MSTTKPTHGGARPGAGRPKKEPTTTIAFRVKVKWAARIKNLVRKEIDKLGNP